MDLGIKMFFLVGKAKCSVIYVPVDLFSFFYSALGTTPYPAISTYIMLSRRIPVTRYMFSLASGEYSSLTTPMLVILLSSRSLRMRP